MLPLLSADSPFPPVSMALDDPNGLLAAGGDLSMQRLINAYSHGIFPWYSEEEPILWWSPDPRTVFLLDQFQPSKSLCKEIKKSDLTVTLNKSFTDVIEHCAGLRKDQVGTWITEEIKQAYIQLHRLGTAHSVEVWQKNQLVGGIYGVSLGLSFCGESMFSLIPNGSKVALSCLAGYLREHGFTFIDCQVENSHLKSLGAINLSRDDYIKQLKQAISLPTKKDFWQPKALDPKKYIIRRVIPDNE